jgi:hypothetical protein
MGTEAHAVPRQVLTLSTGKHENGPGQGLLCHSSDRLNHPNYNADTLFHHVIVSRNDKVALFFVMREDPWASFTDAEFPTSTHIIARLTVSPP